MSDSSNSDDEDIKDKFGKDSSSDEEEKKDKVEEMKKAEPVKQFANGFSKPSEEPKKDKEENNEAKSAPNPEPKEFKEYDDDDRGRDNNIGFERRTSDGRGRGRGNDRSNDRGFGRDNDRGFDRNNDRGFNRDNDRGFGRGFNRDDNRVLGRGFNRDNDRGFGRGNYNDRGFGRGGYRGGRYNNERPGYNNPFEEDRNYGNNNMNSQQTTTATKEFIQTNIEYIRLIQKAFTELSENESADIFNIILDNRSQTIFEIANLLSAENKIKKTTHNFSTYNRNQYINECEIAEAIDSTYINEEHMKVIQYYKVYKTREEHDPSLILPEQFYYHDIEERRRPLKKTENGYYNYIPVKCKLKHDADVLNKEKCCYAHNDNEIKYHSLMYHTKLCRGKCNEICPDAHDLEKDFRMIYDYTNDDIITLMQYFNKNLKKVDDYNKLYEMRSPITRFELLTFKVMKCKAGNKCRKDRHLCYYYHDVNEKRRNPLIFKYSNIICRKAIGDKGTSFTASNCPNGDFCHNAHSNYEVFYHAKNFGKIVKCTRKKINGKCKYIETCYGKHDDLEEGDLEDDKEAAFKDKCEKYSKKLSQYGCFKCDTLPKNGTYFLLNCGCLLCKKCFKKSVNKTEKKVVCVNCEDDSGKTARKIQMGEVENLDEEEDEKKNGKNKEEEINTGSSKKKEEVISTDSKKKEYEEEEDSKSDDIDDYKNNDDNDDDE